MIKCNRMLCGTTLGQDSFIMMQLLHWLDKVLQVKLSYWLSCSCSFCSFGIEFSENTFEPSLATALLRKWLGVQMSMDARMGWDSSLERLGKHSIHSKPIKLLKQNIFKWISNNLTINTFNLLDLFVTGLLCLLIHVFATLWLYL